MPRQNPGEPYYRVDSPEALQILNADPDNTVVVDVRRDDEWVTGHASGAIHINVDEFMDRVDELPRREETAVHLRRRASAAESPASMRPRWASTRSCSTTSTTAPLHGLPPATPRPTETTRNLTAYAYPQHLNSAIFTDKRNRGSYVERLLEILAFSRVAH